jgi:hypothetical protein
VVEIQFFKKEEQSWFLDPKEGFSKKSVSFEIRRDDLTGHFSRILPYRRKYPEVVIPPEMLEASNRLFYSKTPTRNRFRGETPQRKCMAVSQCISLCSVPLGDCPQRRAFPLS